MKNKENLPPRDSWIRSQPGEAIKLNATLQDLWIRKARELRKTRGDMLATSFQLEYILDEIIAEVFFPGLKVIPKTEIGDAALANFASPTVLKEVFIRLFLKATNSQLGRKVDLFNSLTNEIQVFGKLVSEDLKSDLREAVKIRNSFAHFPIYFEATGEPPSQDLSAVFVVRGEKVLFNVSRLCRL
jgi:hypothetical protein